MFEKNKNFIIIISTLVLLWFIGFIIFTQTVFSYKNINILANFKQDTTGIAVLTGGRNRISRAVELLNQNKGKRLLISGVKKGITLDAITSREDVKLNSKLPIDLGYYATDTVGNSKEVNIWAQKYNIDNIILVTSFYHIPRTKLEMDNVIKNKKIEFIAIPSDFVSEKWWQSIKSFKFLAMEYTKYLIVFVQYKVLGL